VHLVVVAVCCCVCLLMCLCCSFLCVVGVLCVGRVLLSLLACLLVALNVCVVVGGSAFLVRLVYFVLRSSGVL